MEAGEQVIEETVEQSGSYCSKTWREWNKTTEYLIKDAEEIDVEVTHTETAEDANLTVTKQWNTVRATDEKPEGSEDVTDTTLNEVEELVTDAEEADTQANTAAVTEVMQHNEGSAHDWRMALKQRRNIST